MKRLIILLLIIVALAGYYLEFRNVYPDYTIKQHIEDFKGVMSTYIPNNEEEIHLEKQNKTDRSKKFYYNNLNESQKVIYDEIYNLFLNTDDYVEISSENYEEIKEIANYVTFDYPEFFYISHCKYKLMASGNVYAQKVREMSVDQVKEAEKEIEDYINQRVKEVEQFQTDYEKALYFYEYLIKNTEYIEDSPYNQHTYSVVLGKSVCMGMAKMFKQLCNEVGIDCLVVTAMVDEGPHALNLVYLDNTWCYVDCVLGGQDIGDGPFNYMGFGVNKEYIERTTKIDPVKNLPSATALNNDYFYRNKLYFESYDTEKLGELINNNPTVISIKVANEELFNEFYEKLIDQQEIFNLVTNTNELKVGYRSSEDMLMIRISVEERGE